MLNVCLVRHGYFPADARVRKEAEALLERGHKVTVICLFEKGQSRYENSGKLTVYRCPLQHRRRGVARYLFEYATFFAYSGLKLAWLSYKLPFDVVQVNTLPDFLVFCAAPARLAGSRVVLDMHELMPEFFCAKYGLDEGNLLARMVARIERACTRYADHVLAACYTYLNQHCQRGLEPQKATVVHNVPSEQLFDHRKYIAVNNSDAFSIICHGTITKMYGYQTVIESIPLIKKAIPNIRFLIVGDGEYREQLVELVKRLRVMEHVVFSGFLPPEQIPGLLASVDVGIVPIIIDQFTQFSVGNKLFEYVAMRKPVIATRNKGMLAYFDEDMITYVNSGDSVDLARAVIELYRSPEKRSASVTRTWERYQEFRWSVSKHTYCQAIEAVVRGEQVTQ